MNLNNDAVQTHIKKLVAEQLSMPRLISEDRFAIECGDGYEVQILVTTNQNIFIGAVADKFKPDIPG